METQIYMKATRDFKEKASLYAMKNKLIGKTPSSLTRLMIIATEEYINRHPIM